MTKRVVVCSYTAKVGHEDELENLLATHGPTLLRLGLRTDEPVQLLRGVPAAPDAHDASRRYLEIFSWRSDESMKEAHASPEVMQIWEGIGACCDAMDFPSFELL